MALALATLLQTFYILMTSIVYNLAEFEIFICFFKIFTTQRCLNSNLKTAFYSLIFYFFTIHFSWVGGGGVEVKAKL